MSLFVPVLAFSRDVKGLGIRLYALGFSKVILALLMSGDHEVHRRKSSRHDKIDGR